MVLSNKKLKQKLRAELTLNQINAEPNPPSSSSSNSLKLLLNSSTNKPILSKREKLRKIRPLQQTQPSQSPNEDEGTKNEEIGNEGLRKKNNKKRKMKVEEKEDESIEKKEKQKKKKNEDESMEKNERQKKKENDDGVANGVVKKNGDDVANGVVVKDAKKSMKKEKQKKKNQLKKQRKKNKIAEENGKVKTAEEDDSNHQEEMPQSAGLTNTNTTTSQENGVAATKVYVGGIPYYSSEDDIRSYFEGCGTITEINCMTFPDTGKFRGIAIISFKTEAAAKRALAFDGADMGGLFLKIQPCKETQATRFTPEMKEGYNRIYVGSLSWEITEEELRKFFSNCNIKSIRFGMDKETGEFRGYAHVDFSDSQSLKTALALDQSVLFGRPVRISCAVPLNKKPVAGSKPGAGEKSAAVEKPSTGSKSGAGEKSVAVERPSAGEKSVEVEKPSAGEKSVEVEKPSAGEKSVAGEKPGTGEKPSVEQPSSVASGKRKNRMCYGCRQKGHNLSECPNQQTVASTTI